MAGNIFPVSPHSTFVKKVQNFPEELYNFNDSDDLTTLMKILLGNSGTGQLNNLQLVARLGQQVIEFSNLDTILGIILNLKRSSSEIYSFATNPFIDQLSDSQWQEVITKDASYRERLLGAAESFQAGATAWAVVTLCEAITQMEFYAVESWRTSGYGRTGVDKGQEIVLIPLIDNASFFTWDQSKANTILNVISKIVPSQFIISFGTPKQTFTNTPFSYVATSGGYSEYFHLTITVNSSSISTPSTIQPGASTRYWIKNNGNSVAPHFAHLQTQEISIDLTGNISNVVSTDVVGMPSDSVSNPSIKVTSTMYGNQ